MRDGLQWSISPGQAYTQADATGRAAPATPLANLQAKVFRGGGGTVSLIGK